MQSINLAPSSAYEQTQPTQSPGTTEDDIRSSCLLIRMDKLQLIVPRILVAEVVDLEGITFTSSPNKDIKIFEWRDYQVPLVSANILSPEYTTQIHKQSKVIVFKAVLNPGRLPYYAMIASTNPRLVVVSAASIEEREGQNDQNKDATDVLMPVTVEGEAAMIPRVEQIERFIRENLPGRSQA